MQPYIRLAFVFTSDSLNGVGHSVQIGLIGLISDSFNGPSGTFGTLHIENNIYV